MKFTELARSLAVASVLAIGATATPVSVAAPEAGSAAEAVHRHFVYFAEPGALNYRGGIPGLSRTANERAGERFDVNRSEVVSYRAFLAEQRAERIAAFESELGRPLNVTYEYDVLHNAIVIENLSGAEVAKLAARPEVSRVEIVRDYELATDRVSEFISAGMVWDGTSTPSGTGYRGQGMVVGIIDTGLNAQHATHGAFNNDASCGFDAGNPKVIAARDCIGSATCAGGSPEDSGHPHGSHVASTAAGNDHIAAGGDLSGTRISGVAPCAHLITYKACPGQSCDGAALAAARQQAIIDQVDVINYSISGGITPWAPGDADRDFLDMINAGIFVAASAGNTTQANPNPIGMVNHRGPWVLTVANSTHDRISNNAVNLDMGGPQNVYGLKGLMTIAADVTGQVADAAALGNALGCSPAGFPGGSMTGRIALISRGDCTFAEKLTNAQAAGAIGGIIFNSNVGQPPIAMGGTETSIPAVMVSNADGLAIQAHVTSNPTSQATISSTTVVSADPAAGDILSSGSLRGPIAGGIEVTAPDITGPGTNIFAAYNNTATNYGFMSGTSMSGPHLAGAGALVKGLHPDWSVIEVKSALQLTAKKEGFKDFVNGTPNSGQWDADDVGNGRVDLSKAALSGLVLDETFANFLAAGGNQAAQRALNLPSMRNTSCTPNCTWTRTVRNTLDTPTSWSASAVNFGPGLSVSVSPPSFSFTGDTSETQVLTITAAPIGDQTAAVVFGEVNLVESGGQSPDLHMTVAIRGAGATGTGDADLALSMHAVPSTVANGGSVTFIANVANFGPDEATGVYLELELPTGVDYVGSSMPGTNGGLFDDGGWPMDGKFDATRGTSNWSCAAAGQLVTCDLTGTIADTGIAPTLAIETSVNVPETGTVTATGTVGADQFDIDTSNNEVSVDVEVTGPGDVIFQNGFEDDSGPPPRNCLDIDGSTANGAFASGDPNNVVWIVDIGANNSVTAVEVTATIEAFDPSWLSEARIGLAAEGATSPVANIGVATNAPGVVNASGAVPLGTPVVVGNDGLLRIERNETFDDPEVNPDSEWRLFEHEDFECAGLHLVCTDQEACDAGMADLNNNN